VEPQAYGFVAPRIVRNVCVRVVARQARERRALPVAAAARERGGLEPRQTYLCCAISRPRVGFGGMAPAAELHDPRSRGAAKVLHVHKAIQSARAGAPGGLGVVAPRA